MLSLSLLLLTKYSVLVLVLRVSNLHYTSVLLVVTLVPTSSYTSTQKYMHKNIKA